LLTAVSVMAALLAASAGCRPQSPASESGAVSTASSAPVEGGKSVDQENWEVYYLQGSKIGYGHTTEERVGEGDQARLRYLAETHLAVKRFGDASQQSFTCTSWETPDGKLLNFESENRLGSEPVTTSGRVDGSELKIETASGGKRREHSQPWRASIGGFGADRQSLLQRPLQPGETRSFEALMPIFFQVASIEMVARNYESTPLLAGSYELLRIDTTVRLPGNASIETIVWTDRQGQVMKTQNEAMGQVSYSTTREIALGKAEQTSFDLGSWSTIKLAQPIADAHRAKQLRYRATLAGGDPARVFIASASQQVTSTGPNTAELLVRAIRPSPKMAPEPQPVGPQPATASEKATAADLAPSSLVQCDDPRIVAMAAEAGGAEQDPWKTAVRLEDFVHRNIRTKNFSRAFSTAAEVAQTLEGDCTEHAVLLTALARARKIPARVAMGLVYTDAQQGFAFHMWTEVYVDGQWLPLDATLGQAGIGAAHLKLAQSDLSGPDAYASFLPIAQVLGRLKLEVLGSS
jgi:hypothetical protein